MECRMFSIQVCIYALHLQHKCNSVTSKARRYREGLVHLPGALPIGSSWAQKCALEQCKWHCPHAMVMFGQSEVHATSHPCPCDGHMQAEFTHAVDRLDRQLYHR
jgi:hypothetical protein